jgi:hypothetical protein
MLSIDQATNAPAEIDLAGASFHVRTLTLAEWGELQAWLKRHAPSPIERAAEAIKRASDDGKPLAQWLREEILSNAQEQSLRWPPKVGTLPWLEALDATPDGMATLLHRALRELQPATALDECRTLAERATQEEIGALVGFLFFGLDPKAGSGAATGTPTPPIESPASPTTGASSSTP